MRFGDPEFWDIPFVNYIYISQHSHILDGWNPLQKSWWKIPSHTPQVQFPVCSVFNRRSHLWTKAGDMDPKLPVGDLVPPDLLKLQSDVSRVFHLFIENDYHEAGYPIKQTHVYVLCIHIHIHIHIYIYDTCIYIYDIHLNPYKAISHTRNETMEVLSFLGPEPGSPFSNGNCCVLRYAVGKASHLTLKRPFLPRGEEIKDESWACSKKRDFTVYICVYLCVYLCVYIYIRLYVYVHTYIHTCIWYGSEWKTLTPTIFGNLLVHPTITRLIQSHP
jgi:hypothetical protein